MDELYAQALALERDAVARYREYARCVRRLGHFQLADTLEALGREEREQVRALERGSEGRELPVPASWECIAAPRTAADALGLALAAERRAESFYNDAASYAQDVAVRMVAALMAVDERRHVEQLERLLGRRPEPEFERRVRRRRSRRAAAKHA
jgi:rubrerythrin